MASGPDRAIDIAPADGPETPVGRLGVGIKTARLRVKRLFVEAESRMSGKLPSCSYSTAQEAAMAGKKQGSRIEDEDRYDALRKQGASKEKAARIANSPQAETARKGGKSPPYTEWTKADLYRKAREVGIEGRSRMSKSQLVDALRNH